MSNQFYQVLDSTGRDPRKLADLAANSEDKWRLQSRSEDGLNIYYHLCLVQPRGREYEIKLPWEAQEICSTCLGQGQIFVWRQDQAAYEATACRDCQGLGLHRHDREISLVVSDGLGDRQVIRKCRGGRLNARLGLQGDLIVNLTWVKTLPEPGDHSAPEAAPSLN